MFVSIIVVSHQHNYWRCPASFQWRQIPDIEPPAHCRLENLPHMKVLWDSNSFLGPLWHCNIITKMTNKLILYLKKLKNGPKLYQKVDNYWFLMQKIKGLLISMPKQFKNLNENNLHVQQQYWTKDIYNLTL